jgi:hypothetical protein
MPPPRDLAHALSISVGVVTRAYNEAARRGLVAADAGRGTFVADPYPGGPAKDGLIDLSINTAPVHPANAMLETLVDLRRRSGWTWRLRYLPPCALDADRRAAAWLVRSANFEGLDWRTSAVRAPRTPWPSSLSRPGDLAAALTFPGMKALAYVQGFGLHGVAMDAEGFARTREMRLPPPPGRGYSIGVRAFEPAVDFYSAVLAELWWRRGGSQRTGIVR